jgi:hypothetical protein
MIDLSKTQERRLLYDLFQAYYDARRNKRKTINALQFELNYEANLFQLYGDIKKGSMRLARAFVLSIFHLYSAKYLRLLSEIG